MKASEAANLVRAAQATLAKEANMDSVLNVISRVSKSGRSSSLIAGLTDGQVYRLQQLGYLVTNSAPQQHEVDWSDRGW